MGLPTMEAAIAAAERELGRSFPSALRERLLRNNGGEIRVRILGAEEDEEWQLHPVWDDSTKDTVRRSASHVAREQAGARSSPDFPSEAISIAQHDGDQLVLLPSHDDWFVWFHETGELEPVDIDWR